MCTVNEDHIWFLKYKVTQSEIFVILSHFCLFCPLTTQKIKILKLKKYLKISFYTFVPQLTIIWCMVPAIWSATDRIFCHSAPFLPFYPSTDQENQNFENLKKTKNKKKQKKPPEGIIILQMCTINDSHMMYGSWDTEHNRHNFLPFWTIFYPFTPLAILKIKTMQNWKKTPGYIIILHKCAKNHDHMLHLSWDTMRDWCNSYFLFWAIFYSFTPLTTQKIKISRKRKKFLEI